MLLLAGGLGLSFREPANKTVTGAYVFRKARIHLPSPEPDSHLDSRSDCHGPDGQSG